MDDRPPPQDTRLEPENAIKLWFKGRDIWNLWVSENPNADISFLNVNFNEILLQVGKLSENDAECNVFSFDGFNFPNGLTDFSGANFGYGVSFENADFGNGYKRFNFTKFGNNTSFKNAIFGTGDISFHGSTFADSNVDIGDGYVGFIDTRFGDGDVDFMFVQFGPVTVNFWGAIFGKGKICFDSVQFGDVGFAGTNFGDGDTTFFDSSISDQGIIFRKAKFGRGFIGFCGTNFGNGEIDFQETDFGEGYINFTGAIFGGVTNFKCAIFPTDEVNFSYCHFNGSRTDFSKADFGGSNVDFSHSTFDSYTDLSNLCNSQYIKALDLSHSTFNKTLDLSFNIFQMVPDLTCIDTSHPISLDYFIINPKLKSNKSILRSLIVLVIILWSGVRSLRSTYKLVTRSLPMSQWLNQVTFKDYTDTGRIRKLKQIAEENKDHSKALDLHVLELKSKHWHENTNRTALFGEFLFDIFSDYGRSELRPIVSMFSLGLVFSPLYALSATNPDINILNKIQYSLTFSYSQILPLLQSSKLAQESASKLLYGEQVPNWLFLFTGFQNISSLILIFLLGLCLRNRFRI